MKRYKNISWRGGYEHVLRVGEIYEGVEVPGIFEDSPYLEVYKDGKVIATAHLSRFEEVTDNG